MPTAVNSGFDAQDSMMKLTEAARKNESAGYVGLDLDSGEPLLPVDRGIFDNYTVKKQMLNSW